MARFDLSVTTIMKNSLSIKPEIFFFGFLYSMLICSVQISASEYLLTRYLDLLWRTTGIQALLQHDTTAGTFISAAAAYNDMYHETVSRNNTKLKKIVGEAYNSKITWTHIVPEYGVTASLRADGYYGNWTDRDNEGFLRFSQDLRDFNVCAWISRKYLSGGFLAGKSFSGNIESEESFDNAPQQVITGLNRDITFDYAVFLGAQYKNISLKGSISRFLNQAVSPMYRLFSNSHFKTFPLCAATKTYAVDLQTTRQHFSAGILINRKVFSTDTLVQSSNALPFAGELVSRELGAYGTLGKSRVLAWECMLDYTGGYMKGTSGSFDYLKQEGIVMKSAEGALRCMLPCNFTCGIFGEYIDGETTEYGYFKADPFSSWNFLNPLGYRFHDASLHYYEAGLYAGKSFRIGKSNRFYADVSFSRTEGRLAVNREEKKIVILIPIYVNDTLLTLFDFEGFNLSCKIDHTLCFKKVSLNTAIRQRVPIWKDPHEKWGGDTGTEDTSIQKKMHGGTEYRIRLEYVF